MELQDLNRWWGEGKVRKEFAPQTKRGLFYEVEKDVARRQIQIITGLRRVGKSTILFQLIDQLIKSGVKPSNILYCTFDEPSIAEISIDDLLKDYSRITDVDYKKEKVYIILDEVQKAKNWADSVKLVYDNFRNIKTLVSGSASLNILSEAKQSLAGRSIYYELRPLNFNEFLIFKGIKIMRKGFLTHKSVLEKEFGKFLTRPFPELINEADANFIRSYIRTSVIEPIILKDIPKEFKKVDILLLEKLISTLLSNPGQYLFVDNLAKEMGRAKTTLYKAIFYLEISFLLRKVMNFRPGMRVASRKLSKVYAYHPALTLPFTVPEEKYVENLIAFELNASYYWRDKEKEIDFIKDSVPVEVKLKSKIDNYDLRWINYFIKKYGKSLGVKKAYVLTRDIEGKTGNTKILPLWMFCFTHDNRLRNSNRPR